MQRKLSTPKFLWEQIANRAAQLQERRHTTLLQLDISLDATKIEIETVKNKT